MAKLKTPEGIGKRLCYELSRAFGYNLTMEEQAEAMGVALDAWYGYAAGRRSPGTATLARAAELGFDVVYILTGRRSGDDQKKT